MSQSSEAPEEEASAKEEGRVVVQLSGVVDVQRAQGEYESEHKARPWSTDAS